jgi:hypothetical protein
MRLLSLSTYIPDHSKKAARKLLRSLPFSHLTALHLTGSCKPWPKAAAALTAATALCDLTLPGVGLAEGLAAHPGVLLSGLQRLHLSDAGRCSAATLRALSSQLTALTDLSLSYNPLDTGDVEHAGVVTSTTSSSNSVIAREVQDCWAKLPALRSLQIGTRKVLQEHGLDALPDQTLLKDPSQKAPTRHYLEISRRLLRVIAALTGLTNLALGPSASLEERSDRSGLRRLLPPLQQLKGLQQLVLSLQVSCSIYRDGDVALHCLRDLQH